MNKPLISIIIPTYNRAHLIGETLDSILAQTYINWECIIVDDGSTDNTKEVVADYIEKDRRFQFHHRPADRPKGGNAARNYGFEISMGTLVNWVDSDDLIDVDHLRYHIDSHLDKDNIQVSISNGIIFEDDVKIKKGNWSNIQPKENCIEEMINELVLWPIGGVIWKKSSIKTIRPFKECLNSSQEWTFHLLQLIDEQVKYEILNNDSYFVRRHEGRIGNIKNINKIKSTFFSRLYIYESLNRNGFMTSNYKDKLFVRFIKSIRDAYDIDNYSLFYKFYFKTFSLSLKEKNKFKNFKLLLFWIPIYVIFKKGNKFIR